MVTTEMGEKVFKSVAMVTIKLFVYISVTVADRPIVTIIDRYELIYNLLFGIMTFDDLCDVIKCRKIYILS